MPLRKIAKAAGTTRIVNRRTALSGATAFVSLAAAWPFRAWADETYLAGQQLELLSSSSAGSADLVIFQAWGDTIERLYPEVRFVLRSNTGGSSALAAEMLADADPDGLTIGITDMDSLIAKALGEDIVDISNLAVIGSLSKSVDIVWASPQSGIRTADDLKSGAHLLPVRSTLSSDYYASLFVNAFVGTRIQPVTGYGSAERKLAFLSGETPLLVASTTSGRPYLVEGTGVPVLKLGDAPLGGEFAHLPALSALGSHPEFAWVPALLDSIGHGRILAAPRATPVDRLEALRDMFMAVAADREFTELVSDLTGYSPTRGDAIETKVEAIVSKFGDLGVLIPAGLDCGRQIAESGEGCAP